MKRLIQSAIAIALLAGLAGIGVLILSPAISTAQTGCSDATLSGNYIYGYDGFEIADGEQLPFAYTGRETYNGDGTMTGVFSGIDSTGVTQFSAYDGVYSISSDCTGTLTTDPGTDDELNFNIFVDESTGDFYFTDIDEGFITQGFNQKVQ